MKRSDIYFTLLFAVLFLPFFLSDDLYSLFRSFSTEWAFTASFIKFAILATLGEMLGQRIRTGIYLSRGFGLLPRALVWGFLGMTVKAAFFIFSGGVPAIVTHLGVTDAYTTLAGDLTVGKVVVAFCISFFLNVFYAPVLMVIHKVTDAHISNTGGSILRFFSVPDVATILRQTNWNTLWGFVLKKTIPLFWIPAQTVTFLLPQEFQILFAAILSTVLGVILAFAAGRSS